ncbi:MAG: tail fiber domain-containing protein [Phycisphaerales bacterium]
MRMHQVVASIVTLALSASIAFAGGGTALTYQGRLLDAGEPANGPFDFEFRLWDAEMGGSQIGSTQIHNAVPVADGLFLILLDFGANAFTNADRWLGVTVDTVLLSPRQPVTRVPYAIQTRGIFVDQDQDVGIGTTSPTNPLHVRLTTVGQAVRIESTDPANNFTALGVTHNGSAPSVLAFNTGTGHAGEFRVFNPNNAAALRGLNQGGGNAGLFEIINAANSEPAIYAQTNGASGTAVFGLATATAGLTTYGGRFESDLPGGRGVFGYATASTGGGTGVSGRSDSSTEGRGVFGYASATSGNTRGGYFKSDSTNGTGVFGWAPATSGNARGVVGQSNADSGRGVYGQAVSSTGVTYGVYGLSQSPDGRGVLGIATSSTGLAYGVLGETLSTSGSAVGVYGRVNSFSPGPNSAAVRGENRGTGAFGIGVHGSQNGSGWGVNGTASSGGIGVRGAGGAYDFFAAGPGINYGAPSSIRWKRSIETINDPLDKVAQLRGVYFDWDEDHGGHHDVGLIAEEVGAVLPEIVTYEENGIDANGMDYSKLTPLLIEAIKELHGEVEYKDSQITELQARLTALEALVQRLVLDRNGGAP